jgi:hypothetical protein
MRTRDSGERGEMGERITVNATSVDKYEKLRELVNKTHKDNPNSEDLAELRRLFDGDPELWRTTGNMARRTLDHLLRT